jgi:hypothetical protein
MTIQNLWYSSTGPLQYDDSSTYGIIDDPEVCREASRAPQHMVEDAPTEYYHVVRLSELTSRITSLITQGSIDSKVVSMGLLAAQANSKADSAAIRAHDAQDAANAATSAAATAYAYAGNAYSYADTAYGRANDAYTNASIALSKLASHGL